MKKMLHRTVRRGESIQVGDSTIEIVDSDRGRVRVKVVHEEEIPVEVKVRTTKLLHTSNDSV